MAPHRQLPVAADSAAADPHRCDLDHAHYHNQANRTETTIMAYPYIHTLLYNMCNHLHQSLHKPFYIDMAIGLIVTESYGYILGLFIDSFLQLLTCAIDGNISQ